MGWPKKGKKKKKSLTPNMEMTLKSMSKSTTNVSVVNTELSRPRDLEGAGCWEQRRSGAAGARAQRLGVSRGPVETVS